MKTLKKTTLIVSLFLCPYLSSSQIQVVEQSKLIEIGKVKAGLLTIVSLNYRVQDKDTLYSLLYRNAKYSHINSYEAVGFSGEGNTLQTLYDLMNKAFEYENPKEYSVDVQLGSQLLKIVGDRMMGIKGVYFITSKGYSAPINTSQLDKLFGK